MFVRTTAVASGKKVGLSLKNLVYAIPIAVVFTSIKELRVLVFG